MDKNTKSSLITFVIFMAIFCLSIWTIFARPATFIESLSGEKLMISQSALSMGGLQELGTIWMEYPDYLAVCISILVLSIAGAVINLVALHPRSEELTQEVKPNEN